MGEIFREIEGFEGLYAVSNFGRIKSLRSNIYLRYATNNVGYAIAILSKGGKQYKFYVHRLVAKAFVPNVNGYNEVNHIDEVKTNNASDNLEWCTHTQNMRHGTVRKRIGISQYNKSCSRCVLQSDLNGKPIKIWASALEAQRVLGFASSYISACCRGKFSKCHNFKFEYV